MRTHRHPNGADSSRPDHGALTRHKYSLLAPEETAGHPAAADPKGSEDIPEETTGTGDTDGRETGTRERNGQHTLLARGQIEGGEEDQGPPE